MIIEERTSISSAVVGGLLAGAVFLAFEMLVGAALAGANGFWLWLRMISSMALGAKALQPSYPVLTAAIVGILIHAGMSVVFALIFIVAEPHSAPLAPIELVFSASGFGCVLWIVNFYVIAPVLAWVWFPDSSFASVQFAAHTFFYGSVLGLVLVRQSARQGEGRAADGPPPRPG